MHLLPLLPYFFGGAFAANAIPHTVAGTMGRAFPTPFAKPPGRGLSSSIVNFLWGFFNAALACVLVRHAAAGHSHHPGALTAFGLGSVLLGASLALYFGKTQGGNTPAP